MCDVGEMCFVVTVLLKTYSTDVSFLFAQTKYLIWEDHRFTRMCT